MSHNVVWKNVKITVEDSDYDPESRPLPLHMAFVNDALDALCERVWDLQGTWDIESEDPTPYDWQACQFERDGITGRIVVTVSGVAKIAVDMDSRRPGAETAMLDALLEAMQRDYFLTISETDELLIARENPYASSALYAFPRV